MLTIPNVHHGYAAAGFVGRVGGPPPGTFGLKVLKGTGLRLDLWKSYLADSAAKSEGPAFAGLGGFGSTSSLAGWVGQLCQVSGNLIASVDAGFSGFRALGELDKVLARRRCRLQVSPLRVHKKRERSGRDDNAISTVKL
jgi:hypothetical protein